MIKILVPTDFSTNSRAGLRFAIQWSSLQKSDLLFVHYFHTKRTSEWTDKEFKMHVAKDAVYYNKKLELFIRAIYTSTKTKPGKYVCLASYGLSADIAIMDYCRKHPEIGFICIATRGAGKIEKLLGTNTGNLTTRSSVPVITVPKNYRIKPIKHILYATDLRNYQEELKKVIALARPLSAQLSVLYLSKQEDDLNDLTSMNNQVKEKLQYNIKLFIKDSSAASSLLKSLRKQIDKIKPSLIVMFTDQHRNFFQKLISPSKTEQISFGTKFPLLSYNKY